MEEGRTDEAVQEETTPRRGQAALPDDVETGFLVLDEPGAEDPEEVPDEEAPDDESDPPDFVPFAAELSDVLPSDVDVDPAESPDPLPLAEAPVASAPFVARESLR